MLINAWLEHHWNLIVIVILTLALLVEQEVVITTTSDAGSVHKFVFKPIIHCQKLCKHCNFVYAPNQWKMPLHCNKAVTRIRVIGLGYVSHGNPLQFHETVNHSKGLVQSTGQHILLFSFMHFFQGIIGNLLCRAKRQCWQIFTVIHLTAVKFLCL